MVLSPVQNAGVVITETATDIVDEVLHRYWIPSSRNFGPAYESGLIIPVQIEVSWLAAKVHPRPSLAFEIAEQVSLRSQEIVFTF